MKLQKEPPFSKYKIQFTDTTALENIIRHDYNAQNEEEKEEECAQVTPTSNINIEHLQQAFAAIMQLHRHPATGVAGQLTLSAGFNTSPKRWARHIHQPSNDIDLLSNTVYLGNVYKQKRSRIKGRANQRKKSHFQMQQPQCWTRSSSPLGRACRWEQAGKKEEGRRGRGERRGGRGEGGARPAGA